jgi:hypothetical protein
VNYVTASGFAFGLSVSSKPDDEGDESNISPLTLLATPMAKGGGGGTNI